MTTIELHSFHWDNYNTKALEAHKKVMTHFSLDVRYTCKNITHGQWLDETFASSKADVIGIIEPDLIPLNANAVLDAIDFARKHDSFLGPAQTSNHIPPCSHIFASPAFFFMTRSCYERLGRPSFRPKESVQDVAEGVSYRAESLAIRYKTLYPTHFEREPREGVWPLGSYGYFGIGTVFDDSVYHLFQSRWADNADLFVRRCREVMAGEFNYTHFFHSTNFEYPGKIANQKKRPKKWWELNSKTP